MLSTVPATILQETSILVAVSEILRNLNCTTVQSGELLARLSGTGPSPVAFLVSGHQYQCQLGGSGWPGGIEELGKARLNANSALANKSIILYRYLTMNSKN